MSAVQITLTCQPTSTRLLIESSTRRLEAPDMTSTITDFRSLTGTYAIDAAHSRFGFVARHAMVTKVRGAFNEFDGTATIDGTEPSRSSVSVELDVASIDTRNSQRDDHLRNNDFLDAANYPKITFTSTSIEHDGGDEF